MEETVTKDQEKITTKEKLIKFYKTNKILFYLIVSVVTVVVAGIIFYSEIKEKRKILLSENYVEAKIYLQNGEKDKATKILKSIINSNDSTYSALSLFLVLNENLINDQKVLLNMFDQILENNQFDEEIRNLIVFKKALLYSNLAEESEFLKAIKPLINKETIWKPHALLLIGDYFFYKKEYLKAREFYIQILSLKNIDNQFYKLAGSQLAYISNE